MPPFTMSLARPDSAPKLETSRTGLRPLTSTNTRAVLFSGKRRVVFVDLGGGRFQPREVRLGVLMGDHYQVQEGLEEGDRVVTSANFLLDSESRLKNVMAAMVSDIPPVEE